MNSYQWYEKLKKPSWAPPKTLFGPVWSILYVQIALSFGYVFMQILRGAWPMSVGLPFVFNLVANIIFTPIQFGLKNNLLAAIDIALVGVTLVWAMIDVNMYSQGIMFIQVPYLTWVLTATVLQFTVTKLNWGK